MWGGFARTAAESDLEDIEPAVAVAHPRSLIAAYRKVVRAQARDDEGWRALSLSLEKVHPLLNRQRERFTLEQRWRASHQCSPVKNEQLVHWECSIFSAIIAHQPPAEQLDALLSRPEWAFEALDLLDVFQDMDEPDLSALLEGLPGSSGKDLERKLGFLLAQQKVEVTSQNGGFLCSLLEYPKEAPREPPSRCLAVQIVLRYGNEKLWEKVLLSGALRPGDVTFFRRRWPREQRFLAFRTGIDYVSLRKSVDLATLGHILVASNRLNGDLVFYAGELDTKLREERARPSAPFHPCFQVAFSVTCMRELIRRHPQVVTGWLDLAIQDDLDWPRVKFMKSTYPLYEALCEALFLERDPRASSLYTALRTSTAQKDSFIRDRIGDVLPLLLFRIDVGEVRSHRKVWYRRCGGDMALLGFATAARQYGRDDFLLELVRDGLASAACFNQAKAISLTGWCGTAPKFRSLLEDIPAEPGSWFDSLKEQALARSNRELWARRWLGEFLTARSLAKSFAAFRLFLRCVDRRYRAWRDEALRTVPQTGVTVQRRMRFLKINYREIEQAIERNEKDLDKYFLYLGIPDERLSPWTGIPPAREGTRRYPEGPEPA